MTDDRWWITVNGHSIGEQQKSLNQKILHARYIGCEMAQALWVQSQTDHWPFTQTVIRIMKGTLNERNGGFYFTDVQELTKDVIG